MNICKICGTPIKVTRTYCSNTCKFSDREYTLDKARSLKKPKSYQFNCHLCTWGTNDLSNKTGSITKHYKQYHPHEDWLKKFPQYKDTTRRKRQLEINESDLTCAVCGEKVKKITNTHLKKHGLTIDEYKSQYGTIINSTKTSIKQKQSALHKQYQDLLSGDRLDTTIKPIFDINTYRGVSMQYYPFMCMVCGCSFNASLDDGKRPICRNCHPKKPFKPTGLGEQELFAFIKSLGVTTINNDRTVITPKELDIVLPDHKIAIEYDGLFWHSERFLDKDYHLLKTISSTDAGYKLIHIFEDEWINKRDVIKSKIIHLLNQKSLQTTIFARKCVIRELNKVDSNKFLEENHLQGGDISALRLGMFYRDVLVAVCTLSKPRISLGNKATDDYMELSRFAIKNYYHVPGALSKFITYIKKHTNIKQIITYADRRYADTTGNVYTSTGFRLTSITKPGYWYFKIGQIKRYHRFNFTKRRTIELGGDPHKNEYENMQQLGYDRIWDCGHLRYELKIEA